MVSFIKSEEIVHQRYKCFVFYSLNLIDLICTQFLLFKAPNIFREVNPVLEPIITDYLSLILKIIIPVLFLMYWDYRYKRVGSQERKLSNKVMNISILVFILINILHTFNLIIYISLK